MNNRNEIEKKFDIRDKQLLVRVIECADNTLIFNASGIVVKL